MAVSLERSGTLPRRRGRLADNLRRFFGGDLFYSFRRSPVTVTAFVVTVVFFIMSFAAQWVAPHNTNDVASLNLLDSFLPPVWEEGGNGVFLLGTDNQGRGVLSSIMFGMRISLGVGFAAVVFSMVIGVALGLISGYLGGIVDVVIMRVADIQLSFPAILLALLIDGVARGFLPRDMHDEMAVYVLVFAIGISGWVQYARTVRAYCTQPEIPMAKTST